MNNVDVACEFGRRCPTGQYVELRYEALIENDVAVGKRLLESLEIPVHTSVVEFCLAQQKERTPFSDPTRNLGASAGGSDWDRVLSDEQQHRSLERIGDHLIRYKFETEENLSRFRRNPRIREAGV